MKQLMHYLRGNRTQLHEQQRVLRDLGIATEPYEHHYTIVNSRYDYITALIAWWIAGTIGWWHYREDLLRYEICTEEAILAKLREYYKKE